MKNDLADETVTRYDNTRHCEEGERSVARRGNLLNGLLRHFVPRNDEYRNGNPPTLTLPANASRVTRLVPRLFPLLLEGGREQLNSNHLTHFTHITHFKKAAFTLAEVLITLGVIGIVAAMTIPTILNKYQEHVMVQKYKKVYSLLNNALLQQYANNGAYYECYYGSKVDDTLRKSQCTAMYEDMKHILKISKICDNNAYKNGCIPDYKGFDTIDKEQNLHPDDPDWAKTTYGGWTEGQIKSSSKQAWVLSDGTIIMFYWSDWGFKHFAVDLNGMQGPNKWGYDLFTFSFVKTDKGAKVINHASGLIEKGGITPAELHNKAGLTESKTVKN